MFGGYANVISHTVARMQYQNRGPIAKHIKHSKMLDNELRIDTILSQGWRTTQFIPKVDGAGD